MADGWRQLALTSWSSSVRCEVAAIREADGVKSDSITVWETEDAQEWAPGVFHIRFDMAAPGLMHPVIHLHDPEPIILAWTDAGDVGRRAPWVFSGRPDFPRDLPHLNPVPDEWPASICLSLAGNDPIYQRFGIRGVLERLRRWLVDAAAGTLNADGWHPIPLARRPPDHEPYAVILEPAAFQVRATSGSTQGFSAGIARSWGNSICLLAHEYDPSRGARALSPLAEACQQHIAAERGNGLRWDNFPWVLVWQHDVATAPVFGYAEKLGDLYDHLDKIDLAKQVVLAISEVEGGGAACRRAKAMDKAIVVVLAVKRPQPLMPGMQGLAEAPDARSFELATYLVVTSTDQQLANPNNRVIQCVPRSLPDAGMFRYMAGVPRLTGLALVGAGALGSTLLDQLIRAGAHDLAVVERDIIEPHNLARHAARFSDIGSGKAAWAVAFGESIGIAAGTHAPDLRGADNQLWIRGHALDVVSADDDELNLACLTATTVLDATANPQVRTRLCCPPFNRRQLRAEMFDGGRLGVLTIGAASLSSDPFDLYFWLCMLHQHDDAVRAWLARERSGSLGLEDVIVGFGCASATVTLPKWAIDQHATAFMPTLIDVLRNDDNKFKGAGIGITPLDDTLRPMGWRWYDAPTFDEYRLPEVNWTLRIAETAMEGIRRLRGTHLPSETGGYLFGGWDRFVRRMTVVAATPAPPNSRGTPSDLDLASVESCPAARALIRRTAGRLHLVGTWHSHPDGCSMPSSKDFLTISAMTAENTAIGIPTLMLIQSDAAVPTIAFSPG